MIRWIRKRRPLLTALFVLAALGLALADDRPPTSLLDPALSFGFLLPWAAMLTGVAVRTQGAGNLRKNKEITETGIYRLVRHPLYTGSLLIFLAYFLSVGDPLIGGALFVAMVLLVYYPTMIDEEANLTARYPEQLSPGYRQRPRLIPNPFLTGEALESDRFTWRAAYANLGVRSAWVLMLLPLFIEILIRVERAL